MRPGQGLSQLHHLQRVSSLQSWFALLRAHIGELTISPGVLPACKHRHIAVNNSSVIAQNSKKVVTKAISLIPVVS